MGKEQLADNIKSKTNKLISASLLVLKILLAALIIPLIIGITVGLSQEVSRALSGQVLKAFLGGIIAYLVLHFAIYKPVAVYKTGQRILEITFYFFSPLVKIAPYLLPVYSLLLIGVFFLSGWLKFAADINTFIFLITFGFTLHLTLSAEDLRTKHIGFNKANYFFGFSLIYILNLVMLAGALHFMFAEFSFLDFLSQSSKVSFEAYQAVFRQLFT